MSDISSTFPADAVWIGSDHAFDLREVYLCFRGDVSFEKVPKQADLYITADCRYKLWINGRYVNRGPARSFPQHQSVDQLDVTPYLKAGVNVLAVQVYQPGYSYFAYVHRANTGLLATLVCDGQSALVTDANWRVRRDLSYNPNVPPVSIYISGVEDHDLRLADDWIDPAYDDSAWGSARVVAPVGGYPWTDMQHRAVPLLQERDFPLELTESRLGITQDDQLNPHLALRAGWRAASQHDFAVDHDGWIPVSLQDGQSGYWLFDLGRGYSCHGWAEVRSAAGGERVAISYSEKWQDGDVYLSDPATYCRVRMTDTFQLDTGDQRVEPFALRGGRLVLFQVTGPTNMQIRWHVNIAEYPLETVRTLTTTDPLLNDIITICENTLRACLLDGFVDNPWRESAQWIGDVISSGPIMVEMSDDTRPLRRLLELGVQGAYPDGILPGVLPSEAHAYTVVDFNFQWIELLHYYQQVSQDTDFVTWAWPTLVKMLDRFDQDRNADGLIMNQTGKRLFLDWSTNSRNEPNAIYNLHYLYALRLAAELADGRRAAEDAARWSERADALRVAARGTYWEDGRWYDDLERTAYSQLTAAYAVLAGAVNDDEKASVLTALAERSLDSDDAPSPDKMVLASPYMHHRVLTALRENGFTDEVIAIIRLRWGRWVEGGFPTTWENWDVSFPDGSQCHGFSAHPRYHLAQIARERGGL